jgi:hypothetical protein
MQVRARCFLSRSFPFIADGGHGFGQIPLRGSVVALGLIFELREEELVIISLLSYGVGGSMVEQPRMVSGLVWVGARATRPQKMRGSAKALGNFSIPMRARIFWVAARRIGYSFRASLTGW